MENRNAVATSGKKTCFDAGKIEFCHCAAVLQTQVPKLCTDLDPSLLHILILGTYGKFARKNNFLALCVCFPQPCSSTGRMFAAPRSRVQYYRRIVPFHNKNFDEMRCKLDSTEIRVRSTNTQPLLIFTFSASPSGPLSNRQKAAIDFFLACCSVVKWGTQTQYDRINHVFMTFHVGLTANCR